MNPIKALKLHQRSQRIMREMMRIKDESIVEYKWLGVAACNGFVCANGFPDAAAAKELYGPKSEDELDNILMGFGESVEAQFRKLVPGGEYL